MIYEVTSDLPKINFGATGVEEILQNVAFILSSVIFSCPLDREFAWDPDVDSPIQVATARNIARVTSAIRQHEPRATVIRVEMRGDPLNGVLKPAVRVSINGAI